jgi:hypothetical protein
MTKDGGILILIQIRGLNWKHVWSYLGKYDVLYKTIKCIECRLHLIVRRFPPTIRLARLVGEG